MFKRETKDEKIRREVMKEQGKIFAKMDKHPELYIKTYKGRGFVNIYAIMARFGVGRHKASTIKVLAESSWKSRGLMTG